MFENKTNGKIYVGKTGNLRRRITDHTEANGSAKLFHQAIKKYGMNNFTLSLLSCFPTEEEAFQSEIIHIKLFKTNIYKFGNDFGYNLTDGGEGASGWKKTEERKKQESEHRKKRFAEGSLIPWGLGKHLSEETKRKISNSHKGKKHSEETIIKQRLLCGEKHPLYGKKKSEEHKTKISETSKKNKKSLGTNNPKAKLIESDVIEILQLCKNPNILMTKIAEIYNVSLSSIENIKYKKTWKHLSENDCSLFSQQKIKEIEKNIPKKVSPLLGKKLTEEQRKNASINQINRLEKLGKRKKIREKVGPKKGTAHHNSKLNEEKVIEILKLIKIGNLSYPKIAEKYGVSTSVICEIKKRKAWKYVKGSDE